MHGQSACIPRPQLIPLQRAPYVARQRQDAIVMPAWNDATFLPAEDGRGVEVQCVRHRANAVECCDDLRYVALSEHWLSP